jgi:D-aminopeptidase
MPSSVRNPVHHGGSKHIRIRYHLVRECAAERRIEIQFVGTNDQLADILTKLLPRIRFLEMKERIGVAAIKEQENNV